MSFCAIRGCITNFRTNGPVSVPKRVGLNRVRCYTKCCLNGINQLKLLDISLYIIRGVSNGEVSVPHKLVRTCKILDTHGGNNDVYCCVLC